MIEYKIVARGNIGDLVNSINKWLGMGWKVQGGVNLSVTPGTLIYIQAIVKEKEESTDVT